MTDVAQALPSPTIHSCQTPPPPINSSSEAYQQTNRVQIPQSNKLPDAALHLKDLALKQLELKLRDKEMELKATERRQQSHEKVLLAREREIDKRHAQYEAQRACLLGYEEKIKELQATNKLLHQTINSVQMARPNIATTQLPNQPTMQPPREAGYMDSGHLRPNEHSRLLDELRQKELEMKLADRIHQMECRMMSTQSITNILLSQMLRRQYNPATGGHHKTEAHQTSTHNDTTHKCAETSGASATKARPRKWRSKRAQKGQVNHDPHNNNNTSQQPSDIQRTRDASVLHPANHTTEQTTCNRQQGPGYSAPQTLQQAYPTPVPQETASQYPSPGQPATLDDQRNPVCTSPPLKRDYKNSFPCMPIAEAQTIEGTPRAKNLE